MMEAWVGSGAGRFWRYHGKVDCDCSGADSGVDDGSSTNCDSMEAGIVSESDSSRSSAN